MNSPEALTALETCERQAWWRGLWARGKVDGNEMLQEGIRAGLTTARPDFGEAAGEAVYALGAEPGLATEQSNVYDEVMHLACIADAVATALRPPGEAPWLPAEPALLGAEGPLWRSGAYLDPTGTTLRRVALASAWSDERHYAEARSWASLGEVCAYGLPMQQATIVLGQRRNGKRHGPWAKGLRHPANRKLRFRKKKAVAEGFKSSWVEIWREDFDDISTHDWLQAMLEDGVLPDVCFNVDLAVPEPVARQRIVELAARKLDRLEKIQALPDLQLTGCDWPRPCLFRSPCHKGEEPGPRFGFVAAGRP